MSDIDITRKASSSARREIMKKINSRVRDMPTTSVVVVQEYVSLSNLTDVTHREDAASWLDTYGCPINTDATKLAEKLINAIDIIEKRDRYAELLKDENNTLRRKLAEERLKNVEILKKIGTMNHVH